MIPKTGIPVAARPAVIVFLLCGLASVSGAQEPRAEDFGWQLSAAIVDQERLLSDSIEGKLILEDLNRKGNELRAENEALQAELETEERALTEMRETAEPEEFRTHANAFDSKVNSIRTDQKQKLERLNAEYERARERFFRKAEQVMLEMMQERGIGMIVGRQAVLLATSAADITDDVIERMDRAYLSDREEQGGE